MSIGKCTRFQRTASALYNNISLLNKIHEALSIWPNDWPSRLFTRRPGCIFVVRCHVEAVDLIHCQAQCFGDPFTIFRICLIAVSDMTDLDELFGSTDLGGRVIEQLLLFAIRFDNAEEVSRLGEVILIIISEVIGVSSSLKFQRWLFGLGLLLPLTIAVGQEQPEAKEPPLE